MSRIVKVRVEATLQVSDDCDVERDVVIGKYFDTGIDSGMILPKDGNSYQDEDFFRVLNYHSIEILEEKQINDEVITND